MNQANHIRPETLRPYVSDWQAPTGDEIKAVLALIESRHGHFTGVDAANYIGIPGQHGRGKGSRTFRRWVAEGGIPYAAWALLCYRAGLGIIWESSANTN